MEHLNWTAISVLILLIGQAIAFIIWIKISIAKINIKMLEIEKQLNIQGKEFREHEKMNEIQFEKYRDEVVKNHNDMNNKIQQILNTLVEIKNRK